MTTDEPTLELSILHHDGREEIRPLTDGVHGIGRSADNWLAPLDTTLSRDHSRLEVRGDEVWIEGLPSRNGTLVNGRRIDEPTRIGPGDEVQVGRTRLAVRSRSTPSDERRHQATLDLPPTPAGSEEIVTRSPVMAELLETADRYARRDLPVLITGESGTGKELLARRIHRTSARADRPFVVLNCPALAEGVMASELFGVEAGVATGVSRRRGRLEEADGGTLFLDEIADLSPEAQAMLLRFLQDGTLERVGGRTTIAVDVRVVAATHRDLAERIEAKAFRHDLYYRIATLHLEIPPLRDRLEDLEPLVEHLLAQGGRPDQRPSPEALAALRGYAFPGNVRELAALVARASILADGSVIEAADLAVAGGVGRASEEEDPTERLLEELIAGEIDFWESVYQPFLDRDLPRVTVRAVVAGGLERCGGSVKELAALWHIGDRYRKLLDFLRNNRLMP